LNLIQPQKVNRYTNTMPAKKKNGFYYFMQEMMADLKRQGNNDIRFAEMQGIASPEWKKMSPTERAKYNDMAKEVDCRSKGVPLVQSDTRMNNQRKLMSEQEAEFQGGFQDQLDGV
jgi:hypothetical protein